MGVPGDGGVVVVAVRAQRFAEAGVGVFVPPRAGQVTAVRADGFLAAGSAAQHFAAGSGGAGVHVSERGGGEGGEDGRVGGDVGGDAFAAVQACLDDLVGVAAVGFGAGRADRGAAGAAGRVDDVIGHGAGGRAADDLAGRGVDVGDLAAQPYRVGAALSGGGVGEPPGVAVLADAGKQLSGSGRGSRPQAVIGPGGEGHGRSGHEVSLVMPR